MPKCPKSADRAAQSDRDGAPGRVDDRAGQVHAHQFRRDDQSGVSLVREPLERVEAVAGPDAVGAVEDAEVDPRAAGRAALDLQSRVTGLELVEKAVERERVLVHPADAAGPAAGIHEVAVVIPLQVGDRVLVEQGVQSRRDVVVRVRMGEIEDLLLPRRRGQCHPAPQYPVRMPACQVAVGIDHLGLDPQPELHAEVTDMVDQRMQALRPYVFVDEPIAETGRVVAPAREPAVVEHESFDADVGGGIRESRQLLEGVVEVHGLPRVEGDRPGATRMLRPDAPLLVEARESSVSP